MSLHLQRKLERVKHKSRHNIELNGQDLIDFSSNDYLGLKQHPILKEAFIEGIKLYGVGSGASQLIGGSTPVYCEVEIFGAVCDEPFAFCDGVGVPL